MKFGLWFLSAAAIGAVGTVLAASLPVPPSLPRIASGSLPATPTVVAAVPAPLTPAPPMTRPAAPPPVPAAPPPQAAAPPPPLAHATQPPQATALPPPAVERSKRITAADIEAPKHPAKRPIRHVAKATPDKTPDRHPRDVAHTVSPHYVVVHKQPSPYPGMPVRPPTHVAMAPPPYGLPPPYWRPPYPPE
jgi:hypothetical protein